MQKSKYYQSYKKIIVMASKGADLLAMKVLMNELRRIPKNRLGKKIKNENDKINSSRL